MKKLLCVVTAICMVLSFAGCSLLRCASMEVEDMLKLQDDEMILGRREIRATNWNQPSLQTVLRRATGSC